MRLGFEEKNRRERPRVWGPTGGWHRSSAIIGLVYGRKGCRRDAAEIEGREGGIEKEGDRRGEWGG